MTVLDAFAVVALLLDEPAADQVGMLVGQGDAALTAVGLVEVIDRMVRLRGVAVDDLLLDLRELDLDVAIPVDAEVGRTAGRLRAHRYRRRHHEISLADCVAAAVARQRGEPLATADPALLDVCVAEGIDVIPLPATDGLVWSPPS